MSVRYRLGALMVAALFGLSFTAAAAGPYPPPADSGGQTSSSRVEVGDCTTFSGQGFDPNTEITIQDNGEPAGTTTSDDQGNFSKEICYDSQAKTGTHVLTATGMGFGSSRTVTANVVVVGASIAGGNTNNGSGGGLPFTGFSAVVAVAAGVGLLALGTGILLLSERRHRSRRRLRRQAASV